MLYSCLLDIVAFPLLCLSRKQFQRIDTVLSASLLALDVYVVLGKSIPRFSSLD
jgi:hypothetical protein